MKSEQYNVRQWRWGCWIGAAVVVAALTPGVLGQSAADQRFNALMSQAKTASEMGDYMRLVAIHQQRQQLVASAPQGHSAVIDQWKLDATAITAANQKVGRAQYAQAVEQLKGRWQKRSSETPLNGDLGVALVRASLAAVVVEDQWVLPTEGNPGELAMRPILQKVIEGDPAAVEARVILGWLVSANPREELLRLDVRESILQRNRYMLPVRASMMKGCAQYEALLKKETGQFAGQSNTVFFTSRRTDISLDPDLSQVRRFLAPIDYSLGISRSVVWHEYMEWSRMLALPRLSLTDKSGATYVAAGGMLFKKSPETEYQWHVLLPPAKPEDAWEERRVVLVRWMLEGGGYPVRPTQGEERLMSRLDKAGGGTSLGAQGGVGLVVYPSSGAGADDLAVLKWCMLNLDTLRRGWQQTELADKPELGRVLAWGRERELSAENPWFDLTARPMAGGAFRFMVDLHPVFAILTKVSRSSRVEPFEGRAGGGFNQYLIESAQGRRVALRPDFKLEMATAGGGRMVFPLLGSRLADEGTRGLIGRLIRIHADLPGWKQAIEGLRGVYTLAGQSADDEAVLQAVMSTTGKPPMNKPPAVSEDEWAMAGFSFRKCASDLRRRICLTPYGIDPPPRHRLVLRHNRELRFYDQQGAPIEQFYPTLDAGKLAYDCVTDFLWPAYRTIPWLWTPGQDKRFINQELALFKRLYSGTGGEMTPEETELRRYYDTTFGDQRIREHMAQLEQASNTLGASVSSFDAVLMEAMGAEGEAVAAVDLHYAAALFREMTTLPFTFPDADPSRPRDRVTTQQLDGQITAALRYGDRKLSARLRHAQVLQDAGRARYADELRRTAAAEWQLVGLPLINEFRRTVEGSGYNTSLALNQSYNAVSALVAGHPIKPMESPATSAAARFDIASAGGLSRSDLERRLGEFYDSRPTLDEYRRVKQWLAKANPLLRLRSPRTSFEFDLFYVSPVKAVGERIVPVTFDEIVTTTDVNSLAFGWLRILHSAETTAARTGPDGQPVYDYLDARHLLVDLTLRQRQAVGGRILDKDALASTLTAIEAMILAVGTDEHLPSGYGPVRFERFTLDACRLELEKFVEPKLVASGLDRNEIDGLIAPLQHMITRTPETDERYARRRYHWPEYERLLDRLAGSVRFVPRAEGQ